MKNRKKEKEVPVRNNPGIYKKVRLDERSNTWKETGKYRALRRVVRDGKSRKEQAVFDNIENAKSFRMGVIDRLVSNGSNVHKNQSVEVNEGLTFRGLIEKWKTIHFLQLEESSKQHYGIRLPHLEFLHGYLVKDISTSVVDELVKNWVKNCPKNGRRETFEKELDLLKVILSFYRKRIDPSYPSPIIHEHYLAADIAKKAIKDAEYLTKEQLVSFLNVLESRPNRMFFSMALTQFCLGLRIGELCGLIWPAIDLDKGLIQIEQVVVWDHDTFNATLKKRPKNKKVRILVIPDVLLKELRRLKAESSPLVQLLFHNNGQLLSRLTVAKAYKRALLRSGILHVSGTHFIRKTAATLANEETGDVQAIQNLMDHSSLEDTQRYLGHTVSQKRKVATALNSVLVNRT